LERLIWVIKLTLCISKRIRIYLLVSFKKTRTYLLVSFKKTRTFHFEEAWESPVDVNRVFAGLQFCGAVSFWCPAEAGIWMYGPLLVLSWWVITRWCWIVWSYLYSAVVSQVL